jgi:hypothetical protein
MFGERDARDVDVGTAAGRVGKLLRVMLKDNVKKLRAARPRLELFLFKCGAACPSNAAA